MLTRVLEPEAMDTAAEARRYDAMDHAEVNRRFVADFLAVFEAAGLCDGTTVLDLGTGTARIPIELLQQAAARSAPLRLHVAAVDLSAEMLALAAVNVAVAGLADSIRLERLDAKTLPYHDGRFTAVMSNSIVHHVPDPAAALAEMVRVTAAPGLIFVRDLFRPTDAAELQRLVERYSAGETPEARQMFAQSLRAALTVDEMRAVVERLGFPASSVTATSDRHWTWIGATRERRKSER